MATPVSAARSRGSSSGGGSAPERVYQWLRQQILNQQSQASLVPNCDAGIEPLLAYRVERSTDSADLFSFLDRKVLEDVGQQLVG